MKIAGLDVGQARIGIAISDEMEILASSVESYHCKGEIETDARAVSEKLIELGAQKIVIGLPKNMNGTEGPAAEKCRAFGEMIGKFLDIEQVYSDERLTTVQAQRTLIGANVSRKKRKNVVDKLAAQLILQNYLDAQGVMR